MIAQTTLAPLIKGDIAMKADNVVTDETAQAPSWVVMPATRVHTYSIVTPSLRNQQFQRERKSMQGDISQ